MSDKTRKAGGFLMADLIVGMTLFGLLVAGLALSLNGFSTFNRYQWTRQQCTAAAVAQLDSVTATGAQIGDDECKRLWPRVTISLERTAGEGQWAGLDRIDARASAQAGPRKVVVELARYIEPSARPTKGEESP